MAILGGSSIADLDDLIRSTDLDVDKLKETRAKLTDSPDPDWDKDFAALEARYSRARTFAKIERTPLSVLPIPNSAIPIKAAVMQIAEAIRQYNGTHGLSDPSLNAPIQKGDLEDLQKRIALKAPILYTKDEQAWRKPKAADADAEIKSAAASVGKGALEGLSSLKWLAIAGIGAFVLSEVMPLIKMSKKSS